MKTILVVYTAEKLTKKEHQTLKRYSFNTSCNIKVGDLLESEHYSTPMQVVEVLSKTYKYVNIKTGELSNKRQANTSQVEIRVLKLATNSAEVIIVSKI